MSSPIVLEDIRGELDGEYPLFLSQIVYRYRSAKIDDLGGRFKRLIDLFEALTRFFCIVALQDALSSDPRLVDRLPQGEKSLDFLRRPSTGGWVGLLRTLCSLSDQIKSAEQLRRISQWYLEPRTEASQVALDALGNIPEIGFESKTKTPNAEFCNALVALRNRFGHGTMPREERLAKTIVALEVVLAHLLSTASFLSAMRVFYVEKRELTEEDEYEFEGLELNGHHPERMRLRHGEKLEARDLYLCIHSRGQIDSKPVRLSPFMLWVMNEELRSHEVFLYNAALRTKLEYVSPSSGAFYRHKELRTDLQELLHLKLRDESIAVDPFADLSAEERAETGEEYFKRARFELSQGRLEDALELVEVAVEYQRKADYLFARAKIELDLGEPMSVVERSLEAVLELEINHSQAFGLLSKIRRGAMEEDEASLESEGEMESPTILHALTPGSFRAYAAIWWLGLVFGWFFLSFSVEALTGGGFNEFAGIAGTLVACVVFVLGLPTVRSIVLNLRYRLSMQLSKMGYEKFENEWYPQRLEELFGAFLIRDCRVQLWETFKRERLYYLGYLGTLLSLGILIIIASNSHHLPLLHFLKRIVDYFLIIFLLYPCIRYVIMSTFFVLEFSKLSIKPMLSRINDDGLRAFGPFFAFNMFLATAANVSFFVGASFMNTGPIYGDLPILFGISVVVMFWSIGLPLSIYKAARSAKTHAIHTYATHLEKAFSLFLKDPNDESLERYTWLQDKQKVIRKISSWPLSWSSTIIFLGGGNLLLVATNIWFILKRTGNLPAYVERLL